MQRYRGVLLDLDGTLLDSVEAHGRSWQQAFAEFGHDVRLLAIERLIGMGGDKMVEQLTGVKNHTPEYEAMSKRHGELFRNDYLAKLGPFAGARDLVLQLRRSGYQVAIASSAKSRDLELLLAAANVGDLIEQSATSDDAKRTKPDPDIVEAAAAKLSYQRDELVMIGDTPYDIEAARRAGVDAIAIASGVFALEELVGAVARYPSLEDLLARWSASPLA